MAWLDKLDRTGAVVAAAARWPVLRATLILVLQWPRRDSPIATKLDEDAARKKFNEMLKIPAPE